MFMTHRSSMARFDSCSDLTMRVPQLLKDPPVAPNRPPWRGIVHRSQLAMK